MTIEEFNDQRWGSKMQCIYNANVRKIASVDFEEKLIGLEPMPNSGADEDDIDWVRCENCSQVE